MGQMDFSSNFMLDSNECLLYCIRTKRTDVRSICAGGIHSGLSKRDYQDGETDRE